METYTPITGRNLSRAGFTKEDGTSVIGGSHYTQFTGYREDELEKIHVYVPIKTVNSIEGRVTICFLTIQKGSRSPRQNGDGRYLNLKHQRVTTIEEIKKFVKLLLDTRMTPVESVQYYVDQQKAKQVETIHATRNLGNAMSRLGEVEEVKPPLGVTPQFIHVENRLQALKDGITRFVEAKKDIPYSWIMEHDELEMWLNANKKV